MTDRVSAETRSGIMSSVRSKNTKPEISVRRILYKAGLRYRIHDGTLPGIPDISNKSKRLAIFVDGCFWHGCVICRTLPKTNVDFWRSKIDGNRRRRSKVKKELQVLGFDVVEIWEHEAEDTEVILEKINRKTEEPQRDNVC